MPRSLARIAVLGMTAICIAVFARAGELAKPVPESAQVTRFTRFNIRYRLRDIVREGVRKVDFYITKDMGATWEYYGEDYDKTSPMTVEVPGEGVYGFVCVVTDRNGNREREPKAGTAPETVIVVDRTPPTAKWLAPTQDVLGRGSHIELKWESADEYFGSSPVKIQYAADAKSNHDKNAKWSTVQENLPAVGSIRWTPPDSKKYHFRLVAEDRAGNAAVAYCAASVMVDNTPPYIVSVKPLRSNTLENTILVEAKDEDDGSGVKEYSLYVSENMASTWTLVKEAGFGGESTPVKRSGGEGIAWKAPKSGEYPLWPVAFDNAGNATPLPSVGVSGPYVLVIDNEPPEVTLSNSFLMDGKSILSNQSRRVEWTSYDPHMREGTTKILLSVDNGKNWQELASRLPANGYDTVNFPFGVHGRECKIKVTVEDDFGNVGEAVSETFRLTGAETTVDAVTPKRPSTDASEDIFGSGGLGGPGGSSAPSPSTSSSAGGGWFGGLGGGSDAEGGMGSLPPLPGFSGSSGADDDMPSLPPLPPRGSATGSGSGTGGGLPSLPSSGGLPSLPGFGGGDSYGGSSQDIYGGGSDRYSPEPQASAGTSAGDWRKVSAAGPLPSAIVGDTLEPDPDSPEYRQYSQASSSGGSGGLGGGLGGLPLPGMASAGGATAGAAGRGADADWEPSPRGGTTTTTASKSESSSYLSGEAMPWETGSSSSSGSLPPGLLAGAIPPPPGGGALPPPPGGGGLLTSSGAPTPPGGGLVPPPPGGGITGGLTPSASSGASPWGSSGGDSGMASSWGSAGMPGGMDSVPSPVDMAALDRDFSSDIAYLPQDGQSSPDDWSTGELVPGGVPSLPSYDGGSSALVGAPSETGSYDDGMSDWASSGTSVPASSGSPAPSLLPLPPTRPVLPSGSLRPPSASSSSQPEPVVTAQVDAPESGSLPLPPMGGLEDLFGSAAGGDSAAFGQDFPAGLPGLDQLSPGSGDLADASGDEMGGAGLPGLSGVPGLPSSTGSGMSDGDASELSGMPDLPGLPGLSGMPGMGQELVGEGEGGSGVDSDWEYAGGDDNALPGFGDGFAGLGDDLAYAPGSVSDGFGADGISSDGDDWMSAVAAAGSSDDDSDGRDKPLPWPAVSSDLPPASPQAPPPGIPGLERTPTAADTSMPSLQTAPGQRPANRRQESELHVRESRSLREEGRTDLALIAATKAVEADSSNAEAYMELSQVNARMTPPDHVKAANLAKEATSIRADWETWWNCADVFYIWAHACNREIQSLSRGGQSAPVHLVDERNSTLSNALIAINNAASVMPGGERDAAKKVGITQGMITYLRALTVPEPANPGTVTGPAQDEYRRQQSQYKAAVTPLLQEAVPYFKNVLDMGGVPGYQETFQLGIIYFRLAGLERDTGNARQASSNYLEAVGYLEQATTASDTPKEGPREAYYMLALSHDQLAEQPGENRARHKELALRYWRQTADFYDAGSAYRTYAEQRIDALGQEMGL